MNQQPPPSPPTQPRPHAASASDDPRDLLQQIHAATVKRRTGRLETLTAVTLGLATLTSTWCGYQASLWSGEQGAQQAAADTAEREAAENKLAGLQIRTQDGLVLLEYWRALRADDPPTQRTLLAHMRPELQRAIEAAVRDGILENPAAPGPLQRDEYALEVETLARTQRDQAWNNSALAAVAGRNASDYVLLTLMLASALFVGGIATTFSRLKLRRALGVAACLVFAAAFLRMTTLPVQWPFSGGPPDPAPTGADDPRDPPGPGQPPDPTHPAHAQ